jgi:uncharacterized repeat protein (TIGR02543 family)
MKKVLGLMLIFLSAFLLIACDGFEIVQITNISLDTSTTTDTTEDSTEITTEIDSQTNVTDTSDTSLTTSTSDDYTIIFETNGGNNIVPFVFKIGDEIQLPIPEKEGYTFLGWAVDNETASEIINETYEFNDSITLYAKWEINTYQLQFLDFDGNVLETIAIEYHASLTEVIEPIPLKEGYSFINWDMTLPDIMPAENITCQSEWEINQYTITFNTNDGSAIDAITQDYDTDVSEPTEPTKEGYTFDDWYSDSELSNEYIFTTIPTEDITVYAKWTINEFTITFNSDGGTDINTITQDYDTDVTEPVEPTKEGYTFVGWYSDSELSLAFIFETMPSEDITLYAKWNINAYTFQYIDDDGTVLFMDDYDFNSDLSNISINHPTKTGYTFSAWDVECPDTMPANNVTITATYTINQYTITFSNDGGTDVTAITQDYDTVVLEPTETTKEGYTFDGWYSDSDLSVAFIFETMPAEDITLYAKWIINQYIITFNSNGGTDITVITQDYNTVVIEPVEPTKEGYTFGGWYSDSNLSVAFIFETMPAKDNTLYAKWNINSYTFQYIDDDGSVLYKVDFNYGVNLIGIFEPTTSKTGYTFIGWDVEYPDTMPANNVTITAEYTINQYTITFSSDGGTNLTAITQDYDTVVLAPTEPTKEGYTFDGWYRDSELTSEYIFTTIPKEDINLYAKWTINQYTISFNSNGGTDLTVITQDYNTVVIEPVEPTKEGYTFGGWYSDSNLSVAFIFETMPAKDNTLYAKWNINSYTFQYIDDDGSVLYKVDFNYGVNLIGIFEPTTSKTGYTFIGWDVEYPDTMPANNVTITAEYTINQYTITFISNGGSEVITINQDYNTDITEPEDPTKEGYTLDGWYRDSELSNEYTFTTIPAENITVYAKWTINEYSITFNSDGGTDINAITQDFNTDVTEPAEPTKEGYTFVGWYSDSELSVAFIFETMPSEDISLYAKWSINQYTVTFYDKNKVTVLESYQVDYGSEMLNPSIPEREGFLFGGYYTEVYGQGTMVYNEDLNLLIANVVNGNLDLYVHWTIKLNGNIDEGFYIYMGELPDTLYDGVPGNLSSPDPVTGYVTDSLGIQYKMYGSHYYIVEPIKWMVIAQDYVDGQVKLQLISEKIIDALQYDDDSHDWKTSEIREYLNGPVDLLFSPFGSIVFNSYEIEHILLTTLNADDPNNSTEDYLFLLSYREVQTLLISASDKISPLSGYVDAKVSNFNGNGAWWMRYETEDATDIDKTYIYFINFFMDGLKVNFPGVGIRPSMNIYLDYDQSYEIYFDGNGGNLISGPEYQIVHHGDTAIAPKYEFYGYDFVGWDEEIDPILKNATIKAIWEEIMITHEFIGSHGELISGLELQVISIFADPEYPIYHMEGNNIESWQIIYNEYSRTYQYYAVWANPIYEVIFDVNLGTLTSGEDVQYITSGLSATPPNAIFEGHELTGWDDDYSQIEENVTINAIWAPILYTYIFRLDGATLVSGELTQYVYYGEEPEYPVYSKEGSVFVDWLISTTPDNEIYYYPIWDTIQFSVDFVVTEGDLIEGDINQIIDYGESAIEPVYEREGFVIVWTESFDSVKSNLTIYGAWEVKQCMVTFVSAYGSLISGEEIQYIPYGESAIAPVYGMTGHHYTFDIDFDTVYDDLTVTAIWAPNEYKVTFDGSGGTLVSGEEIQYVTYQNSASAPIYSNGTLQYLWDIVFDTVTSDITVTAIWGDLFTVTFNYDDGEYISGDLTQTIFEGDAAIAPVLSKEGYYLTWDVSFNEVLSDLTINAVWIKLFTVTFDGNGGTLISGKTTQNIIDGGYAFAPWFEKEGYELSWDISFDHVTSDLYVTAIWTPIYTVTFNGNGGTYVSGSEVQYITQGESAIYPIYELEGYYLTFDASRYNIQQDIVITAVWLPIYTVTFNGDGGELISGEEVIYVPQGLKAEPPVYEKEGFRLFFDHDLNNIQSNLTINAVWKPIYKVTFDGAGATLVSGSVEQWITEGMNAIPPVFKIENEYLVWDVSYENITSEVVITAQWSEMYQFIIVGDGVRIIGINPLYPYPNLYIPETLYGYSVTQLANYILDGTKIRSVYIPKSILVIYSTTFAEYGSLQRVVVDEENPNFSSYEGALFNKDKTRLIAHPHAIYGEYIIPDCVTSVDLNAFNGSNGMTSIIINASVSEIRLSDAKYLQAIIVNPNNQAFVSVDGVLYDKALTTLISYPAGRDYLSAIPDSVYILGQESFRYSRLISIELPDQITEIRWSAFREAEKLTNIHLPSQLTYLGRMAFWGAKNLLEIDIPDGVTTIHEWTFTNCTYLRLIILPEQLTTIKDYAFSYTRSLDGIVIDADSVVSMASNIFSQSSDSYYIYVNNSNLSEYRNTYSYLWFVPIKEIKITFMDGEDIYHEYTAMNYDDLEIAAAPTFEYGTFINWYDDSGTFGTSIYTIPKNLVEDYVLYARWKLNEYTISFITNGGTMTEPDLIIQDYGTIVIQPNDPIKSGYNFRGWYTDEALTDIYHFEEILKDDVMLYAFWKEVLVPKIEDYTFVLKEDGTYEISRYIGLDQEIIIPSSYLGLAVTSIGERAFESKSVVNVTIPDGITSIGYKAFNTNSLIQIVIPNSVNVISNYAFYYHIENTTRVTIFTSFESLPAGWETEGNVFTTQVVWGFVEMRQNGVLEYVVLSNNTVLIKGLAERNVDTDIHIPETIDGMVVRRILPYAFYYNTSIVNLTMPNTIEAIEKFTFYASKISSISISSSATYIGNSAFENSSITSIYIPASVKSIENSAFTRSKLSTIIFEAGSQLTTIEEMAFYYASSLTSVNFPASLTYIGDGAFWGASKLTTITFEEGSQLTYIGNSVFAYASSLTNIDIPESLTYIGGGAFYRTIWLTNQRAINPLVIYNNMLIDGRTLTGDVILPDGLEIILPSSLLGNSNMTSIYIPASVTSIGQRAFYEATALSTITFEEGSQLTNIDYQAFSGASSLTSIIIPASVTSIGASAFDSTASLTTIIFAEDSQLVSIGERTFFRASGLTSISIPASVTSIEAYAFYNATSLTSVTFAEGSQLTTIGYQAFANATSLMSIIIPASVTSIGASAFDNATSLTSIIIPASVTSIGASAFNNTTSLTTVTFAEDSQITTIGASAFYGASGLTSIIIPTSVTSIGPYAFSYASSLTSIIIPNGVTSIGASAFFRASALTSVIIPASVITIGESAFNDMDSLTSVIFAEGSQLITIGERAFSSSSLLTSIYIPISVEVIGGYAFYYCPNLTIYAEAASKSSGWDWMWNASKCPVIWGYGS